MVVKTFRGLLADNGQDSISLSTTRGKVGYRIVKIELFAETPGTTEYEHVVKIYKEIQTSITGTVNFADNSLLGVSYLEGHQQSYYIENVTTVFDNEIFNQDIYITHVDVAGSLRCNYYLELKVIDLSDHAAEYTTLKDIRSRS